MKNTIKLLILSAFAGGVLMFSTSVSAEQPEDSIVMVQDAEQNASELNLNDEGSADNWWGLGGFGWGLGTLQYGLGIYGLGLGGYGACGLYSGGWGWNGGCGCLTYPSVIPLPL